ncbi:hypothetical protein GIB67_037258 [Kingdonia uniflora]|uniref:WRC domain-containing protein n=1 Tax=Kingdonia uniflora TaxID=39325 RepID=A0A7J7MS02_9MAGN|nr:hypothetical protein GIB67_037258 [Kingdonia uniflora]
MRIRKHANLLLQSLLSPPLEPPPPISPTTPPPVETQQLCELNRSPWDVISFLPQSELSYADGLRQVKLEEVKLKEEVNNGGAQSSNTVERVKPKVEIKEEFDEMPLIDLAFGTERVKKGKKKIGFARGKASSSSEYVLNEKEKKGTVLNCCNKTDGKGWRCRKEAKEGNTLCHHHLEQLKTYHYQYTRVSKKSEKSKAKDTKQPVDAPPPTPLARRVKKKATRTSDFYYYSGFGPLWGKSRSEGKQPSIKIEPSQDSEDVPLVDPPPPETTQASQVDPDIIDHGIHEYEDDDDDDEYYDVGVGEKRIRKPIKERSLKSLL